MGPGRLAADRVAPSPLREPAHRNIPKQAEDWDIERIVGKYADAAERMQAGGMDGVEIEAYGHLFDQFLSPLTNRRNDESAATTTTALRFGWHVLSAIRERVGPDFIVGIRMVIDETVAGGIDTRAGLEIARNGSRQAGLIDFVNVIRGHIEHESALTEVIPIHGMPSAPHLDFAGHGARRHRWPCCTPRRSTRWRPARHAIREGKVDLVGMTRAHLADPHIVRKIIEGREAEIRPCVGATYCLDRIYAAGEALCLHNAATSREQTMPHVIPRAATARRVVVVGAGPGGLEAARVAGERGHDVIVLEAMPWAGGQLNLAVRNPRRQDLQGIVDWRVNECKRLGVDIRYDTFADADRVLALDPDVVIVATGGQPQLPELEDGADLVVTSWDVLGGDVTPTGDVLFFDDNGTHSAMSAAEMIARSGAKPRDRHARAHVRDRGRRAEPRAVRAGVQRVRDPDHAAPQGARGAAVTTAGSSVELGSEQSAHRTIRLVDWVVVDHGTSATRRALLRTQAGVVEPRRRRLRRADGGRPQPLVRNPAGRFQLFRIGDAVAAATSTPPCTTRSDSSKIWRSAGAYIGRREAPAPDIHDPRRSWNPRLPAARLRPAGSSARTRARRPTRTVRWNRSPIPTSSTLSRCATSPWR